MINQAEMVIGCFELARDQELTRLQRTRAKALRAYRAPVNSCTNVDALRAADNAVDDARDRYNAAQACVSALRAYATLINAT